MRTTNATTRTRRASVYLVGIFGALGLSIAGFMVFSSVGPCAVTPGVCSVS